MLGRTCLLWLCKLRSNRTEHLPSIISDGLQTFVSDYALVVCIKPLLLFAGYLFQHLQVRGDMFKFALRASPLNRYFSGFHVIQNDLLFKVEEFR